MILISLYTTLLLIQKKPQDAIFLCLGASHYHQINGVTIALGKTLRNQSIRESSGSYRMRDIQGLGEG